MSHDDATTDGGPLDGAPVDDRLDRWLLEAGFDPDPDATLVGRAADELATVDEPDADPWAAVELVPVLTDDQRAYLVATSPALGAELPGQSLTGGDPFGGIPADDVAAADREVIDFDDDRP